MPGAKIVKAVVLLNQTTYSGTPVPFYTPPDSGLFRVFVYCGGTGVSSIAVDFTDDNGSGQEAEFDTGVIVRSATCRQKAGIPITYTLGDGGSPYNFSVYIVLEKLELD